MMRRLLVVAFLLVGLPLAVPAQELRLPNQNRTVKFAVMGDTGQPGTGQDAIAKQMAAWRTRFPFEFVLMMGDNLYGSERPKDYQRKFEIPYKPLLDAGVKFYAALGNHDDDGQILYKPFNMGGKKYYSFKPANGVRFFALDSNYVDAKQVDWLQKELAASGSDWKIAFFHHPLYSSGATHGSADLQRDLLEPVFMKHGVNVVLIGARALLRAHQAAKGHRVLHRRLVGKTAKGRPEKVRADRIRQ